MIEVHEGDLVEVDCWGVGPDGDDVESLHSVTGWVYYVGSEEDGDPEWFSLNLVDEDEFFDVDTSDSRTVIKNVTRADA